jgi:hypothetical protein
MKALMFVFTFCSLATGLKAGGPYRNYLLSKVYVLNKPSENHLTKASTSLSPAAFIPRFERPKGAIFCRMEDKVTKATKVWLKIGVQ